MNEYLTRIPWQSTPGSYSDVALLGDSLKLRLQSFDLRALVLLLYTYLCRDLALLNPGVQTMRSYPQTVSSVCDCKTMFGNLPTGLDLAFLGKGQPA